MRNLVYQTFRTLINLCLLRASPAELPFSIILLTVLIALELGLNIVTLNALKGVSLQEVVLATFLSIVVLIGLIYLVLARKKLQTRLHKVLIAWFATELILTMILKIVMLIIPESILMIKVVQAVIEVIFFTWNVAIKAYILRCSCDMKVAGAILMTFGILLVSTLPMQLILGDYLPDAISQT